ncbi:hypothetical protein GW17_00008083 [Ensete ventricosum]|nr:hypothetical protein GW17_00008083 [Ensete ventricosum]
MRTVATWPIDSGGRARELARRSLAAKQQATPAKLDCRESLGPRKEQDRKEPRDGVRGDRRSRSRFLKFRSTYLSPISETAPPRYSRTSIAAGFGSHPR